MACNQCVHEHCCLAGFGHLLHYLLRNDKLPTIEASQDVEPIYVDQVDDNTRVHDDHASRDGRGHAQSSGSKTSAPSSCSLRPLSAMTLPSSAPSTPTIPASSLNFLFVISRRRKASR